MTKADGRELGHFLSMPKAQGLEQELLKTDSILSMTLTR